MKENDQEVKPEEILEKPKQSPDEVLDAANKIESEEISKRKAELEELEKRIEVKTASLNKIRIEIEDMGRGVTTPEVTPEEAGKAEVNKWLKNTGLVI